MFRKAVCLWNHDWQAELIYCVMFSPPAELYVDCLQGPYLTTQGCSAKAPWGLVVMLWAHQETCTSLIPAAFFFFFNHCPQPPIVLARMWVLHSSSSSLSFFFLTFNFVLEGFPGGQMVRNLPAMWETWVWSLGREDSLENGMATHSIILASRIPRTEEPVGL